MNPSVFNFIIIYIIYMFYKYIENSKICIINKVIKQNNYKLYLKYEINLINLLI